MKNKIQEIKDELMQYTIGDYLEVGFWFCIGLIAIFFMARGLFDAFLTISPFMDSELAR
jgi:hypothetical protein